ncbi:MAG: polyprenyl synthetase family protein [Planctomycetota bacterium]|nr:polyprenyl synthetase family protein [Planctomycetota bacterium]MDA1179160.1 polyprenyl synthetase family protein [Planctomycetota bacterium]
MSIPLPALLSDRLHVWRSSVDERLASYCELQSGCPEVLRDAIRYSLLAPGKRLRPLLVLSAAEACGCDPGEAIPAACAVEMVHAYSLIHDDLPAMDDDDLRRGRPTCHVQYGEAVAILAGDALLAMAFESLATDLPPEVAAECCRLLACAAGPTRLVGGQADDLAAEHDSSEYDLAQLESIHHRKTGALLAASLQLGATIAGAPTEQISRLEAYGLKIGLAFQVVDDLLDLSGDEQVLGKRTGRDSDLGKLTYPRLLGIPESRLLAANLVEQACGELVDFSGPTDTLESIARYILARDR